MELHKLIDSVGTPSWKVVLKVGLTLYLLAMFPLLGSAQAENAKKLPELPWKAAEAANYPPGVPGRDYKPVFVPNGAALPFKVVGRR
jgi:hypothetical protein